MPLAILLLLCLAGLARAATPLSPYVRPINADCVSVNGSNVQVAYITPEPYYISGTAVQTQPSYTQASARTAVFQKPTCEFNSRRCHRTPCRITPSRWPPNTQLVPSLAHPDSLHPSVPALICGACSMTARCPAACCACVRGCRCCAARRSAQVLASVAAWRRSGATPTVRDRVAGDSGAGLQCAVLPGVQGEVGSPSHASTQQPRLTSLPCLIFSRVYPHHGTGRHHDA